MNESDKMLSFKVIYKNGHFYTENDKRLILSEKKPFEIFGNENDFSTSDDMLETHPPRTSDIMKSFVEQKYGEENIIKMLPEGTAFHFQFGLGRRKKGVLERVYAFEGILEEDAYLHLVKKTKVEIPESWRIEACRCSITNSLFKDFELPEIISGNSPSAAFSMLISTHFSQQRVTGISIYDNFKIEKLDSNTLRSHNSSSFGYKQTLTLGELRKLVLEDNLERIILLQKQKEIDKAKAKFRKINEK